jgi:hypothetical protein
MESTSTRIDGDEIVTALRSMGYPAYVEQTGGGCATIMVGEEIGNTERYQVLVGPGWFDGPNWTKPVFDTADLYVGPDDDGEVNPTQVEQHWDADKVAEEVMIWMTALSDKS